MATIIIMTDDEWISYWDAIMEAQENNNKEMS